MTLGLFTLGGWASPARAQEVARDVAQDAFFAGIVMESTPEKITVGRTVRGQAESRSFRVTPQTRIDGKMAARVRVTVRYIAADDGDTATMIIVRPPVPAPPAAKKK